MSNKSRGPGQRKPTLGDFGRQFAESVKATQAQMAENNDDEVPNYIAENDGPSGVLPIPKRQIVNDKWYRWEWEPILDTVTVWATLYLHEQQWKVVADITPDNELFDPEDARKIGEAFLAASNWQYIWKDHFADMSLAEVLKPKFALTDATKQKLTEGVSMVKEDWDQDQTLENTEIQARPPIPKNSRAQKKPAPKKKPFNPSEYNPNLGTMKPGFDPNDGKEIPRDRES